MTFRQLIDFILRKKEEKLEYPPEFCIVTYNEIALRNGIEDTQNKVIIRYKYNRRVGLLEVYRTYGYSDSLVHNLKTKLKIPVYDSTLKETKFPIYDSINLAEVSYDRG